MKTSHHGAAVQHSTMTMRTCIKHHYHHMFFFSSLPFFLVPIIYLPSWYIALFPVWTLVSLGYSLFLDRFLGWGGVCCFVCCISIVPYLYWHSGMGFFELWDWV
ncbi:hypothetical protein BDD12DRAFT_811492 [Trichophaea hybrida]|nr:hypothetical protein BDD12DRAFT_811492 [Trichophaea hybrida]